MPGGEPPGAVGTLVLIAVDAQPLRVVAQQLAAVAAQGERSDRVGHSYPVTFCSIMIANLTGS